MCAQVFDFAGDLVSAAVACAYANPATDVWGGVSEMLAAAAGASGDSLAAQTGPVGDGETQLDEVKHSFWRCCFFKIALLHGS